MGKFQRIANPARLNAAHWETGWTVIIRRRPLTFPSARSEFSARLGCLRAVRPAQAARPDVHPPRAGVRGRAPVSHGGCRRSKRVFLSEKGCAG